MSPYNIENVKVVKEVLIETEENASSTIDKLK